MNWTSQTRRVSPDSRSLWHLIESIAIAMAQGYGLARTRALSHADPMTRVLGQRDHLYSETALLEREVAIFRAQRMAKPPRRRPQFDPGQRAEILQLSVLRGVEFEANCTSIRATSQHYSKLAPILA